MPCRPAAHAFAVIELAVSNWEDVDVRYLGFSLVKRRNADLVLATSSLEDRTSSRAAAICRRQSLRSRGISRSIDRSTDGLAGLLVLALTEPDGRITPEN
jgi:hypothetical protein